MFTLSANRNHSPMACSRYGAILALSTLGAILGAPASAADTPADTQLEQVLVTGTRLSDVAAQLPTASTVIDQQNILLRAPDTLLDLLRTLPGVQLVQPGGGAGVASFYMRGCQPNYTLFLVDGVKVTDSNDSRGGSFDLSTVSPGEISRVEVIRGPQSAVYGADALCGVVNVITKSRSDIWNTTASVTAGLRSAYDTALELSGPVLAKGGLSLRAATGDQGATVPGSSFGASAVNGKLTLDNGTGWRVVVHGRHADNHGTSYPDQSGGPQFALSPARDVRSSRATSFDAQGEFRLAAPATLNAVASSYHHQVDFASPAILTRDPERVGRLVAAIPARGEKSDLKRIYGLLDVVVALPGAVRATLGADYMRERTSLDGYLEIFPGFNLPDGYRQTRHVAAAFGELQYSGPQGLTLLGSIRRDDPSTFAAQTTSRAGFAYTPDSGDTEFRAYWGQGFKLPSLWALGNALVGNSALLPEKSRTAEIGASRWLRDRRLKLSVAVFDNRFTNLIDFDNNLFQFVNRREVTSRGGELELQYQFAAAWHVKGEATYSQIDPKDSAIPIRQRPKWRGSVEAWWVPTPQWSLYATWLTVGRTFDNAVPTGGVMLGGYSRVDLNGEWQATRSLSVGLAVDNVLDKRFAEAVGFLTPGIEPRLSVRYRF